MLDVVTDPEVPPLPPHIRFEQAKGFARALLHGDPAAPTSSASRCARSSKIRDALSGMRMAPSADRRASQEAAGLSTGPRELDVLRRARRAAADA